MSAKDFGLRPGMNHDDLAILVSLLDKISEELNKGYKASRKQRAAVHRTLVMVRAGLAVLWPDLIDPDGTIYAPGTRNAPQREAES